MGKLRRNILFFRFKKLIFIKSHRFENFSCCRADRRIDSADNQAVLRVLVRFAEGFLFKWLYVLLNFLDIIFNRLQFGMNTDFGAFLFWLFLFLFNKRENLVHDSMDTWIFLGPFLNFGVFQIKRFLVHFDTKIKQDKFTNVQLVFLGDFKIWNWERIWLNWGLGKCLWKLLDGIFHRLWFELIRKLVEISQFILLDFEQINKVLPFVWILLVNVLVVVVLGRVWWFLRPDGLILMIL